MQMEDRTKSLMANLDDLEHLILCDPSACAMYKQFLTTACPHGRKAHHVDFFADIAHLEERAWRLKNKPRAAEEQFLEELVEVYERYFVEGSPSLLDIKRECLERVRANLRAGVSLKAFQPAIRVVAQELVFVHFEGFIQSPIFKEYREKVLAHANFPTECELTSPTDKHSTFKLRSFFGERSLRDSSTGRRKSLEHQPSHIKEYKLSKIFGERVGVEKASLLEYVDEYEDEEPGAADLQTTRRDRRLHVFFGDYFEVDDTLFSERIRAQEESLSEFVQEFPRQPTHVNSFRLARFFGAIPPQKNAQGCDISSEETGLSLPRHSRARHLHRFFGEWMDPEKESSAISFAIQPPHVKGCKLKKIFGESASHTISLGGDTWPPRAKSREKLERIFGPFD